MRIAIIQTHAIQHFCPQFASYAKLPTFSVKVYFETSRGIDAYYDKDFKQAVTWSSIDVSQFEHEILDGKSIDLALNEFNPTMIIIYGYHEKIHKKAFKYAKRNSIKVLYIADSENHQHRNVFKEFIKRNYLKSFFTGVDYCLSVGDSNEDVYRGYNVTNDRIIRMFFPINIVFFNRILSTKEENGNKIKNQYNIPDDYLVLTNIGKLVHWKRQIDIIKLLLELETRHIKAVAFIIGSGDDYDKIDEYSKKLTWNRAILTGFMQPEDIANYLCATDVYIHPAEVEPHSLAISEAIYCGCPVVLSDRCGSYGPTDDVQPGRNGFVFSMGDIADFANKIEFLSANKAVRAIFARESTLLAIAHQKMAHGEALQQIANLIEQEMFRQI